MDKREEGWLDGAAVRLVIYLLISNTSFYMKIMKINFMLS